MREKIRKYLLKKLGVCDPKPIIRPIEMIGEDKHLLSRKAKEITENEAFIWAFEKLQKDYQFMWLNSEPMQKQERESVWHRIQALNDVKLKFVGIINEMLLDEKLKEEEEQIKQAASERTAGG